MLRQMFVENTFGHTPSSDPKDWPDLEDIFTCIDLSANTGHHLGPNYSPSSLRTVRRALIVRIIRMLRQTYVQGRGKADLYMDEDTGLERHDFERVSSAMKSDGHLGRCHLKGREGNAANVILTAVGHNLRRVLAWLRALLSSILIALWCAVALPPVVKPAS
jgi:IS5 family transposase